MNIISFLLSSAVFLTDTSCKKKKKWKIKKPAIFFFFFDEIEGAIANSGYGQPGNRR